MATLPIHSSAEDGGAFCSNTLSIHSLSSKGGPEQEEVLESENMEVDVPVVLPFEEEGDALMQAMVLSSCLQDEEEQRGLGEVKRPKDM